MYEVTSQYADELSLKQKFAERLDLYFTASCKLEIAEMCESWAL